jgi:hypothetical protein
LDHRQLLSPAMECLNESKNDCVHCCRCWGLSAQALQALVQTSLDGRLGPVLLPAAEMLRQSAAITFKYKLCCSERQCVRCRAAAGQLLASTYMPGPG